VIKSKNKEIGAPAIIHGESGLMDLTRDVCEKLVRSNNRVQHVTSPYRISMEYLTNYDSIFRKQV
jgi:hypothetical protein